MTGFWTLVASSFVIGAVPGLMVGRRLSRLWYERRLRELEVGVEKLLPSWKRPERPVKAAHAYVERGT